MPFVITEDTAVTLPFNPCHFLLKDIVIKPQKKKKKKKEIFSDQDLSPNHEKESTVLSCYCILITKTKVFHHQRNMSCLKITTFDGFLLITACCCQSKKVKYMFYA